MEDKAHALVTIDAVLQFFKKGQTLFQETLIKELLNKIDIKIDASELSLILEKLHRDKLIYSRMFENILYYGISYEGLMFDGYLQQVFNDGVNLRQKVESESRNDRYQTRLLWGTWIAGVTAFLLLAWQVFLWYFPKLSDYPLIWWWQH